jgi:hypothetical protein
VSAEEFQRQRLSALPLLLLAAIDLVIAFIMVLGSGLNGGFLAIFAIGMVLAGVGLWKLYRKPPE